MRPTPQTPRLPKGYVGEDASSFPPHDVRDARPNSEFESTPRDWKRPTGHPNHRTTRRRNNMNSGTLRPDPLGSGDAYERCRDPHLLRSTRLDLGRRVRGVNKEAVIQGRRPVGNPREPVPKLSLPTLVGRRGHPTSSSSLTPLHVLALETAQGSLRPRKQLFVVCTPSRRGAPPPVDRALATPTCSVLES